MGAPKKIDVNGQQVWICCDGCKDTLLASPEEDLAKLKSEWLVMSGLAEFAKELKAILLAQGVPKPPTRHRSRICSWNPEVTALSLNRCRCQDLRFFLIRNLTLTSRQWLQ